MRAVIGYLIVAAALAIAAAVLWSGSDLERRVAAAERDLVTLRYQEAGALSPIGRSVPSPRSRAHSSIFAPT